jgi:hypothetical protein
MHFHSDIDNNVTLPIDLFDSVAENLINNALKKTSAKRIDVRLLSNSDVTVSSGSGMGIGLCQSAIMALAFNYELEFSQNERGRICFNLYQNLA